MVARDCRPGNPPDGTVRADRRSRDPLRAASCGRPELSDAGAGVPGGGAGAAGAPSPSTTGCGCATGGWGTCFPNLPHQPGYHKRVKAAAPLVCTATRYLASLCPSQDGQLRLLDATPVPCATSRQTVRRSELAGWANYGYCAAHSRWYWGLKLYLLATPGGMPVTWCLADPKIGEREVAAELLDHAGTAGRCTRA